VEDAHSNERMADHIVLEDYMISEVRTVWAQKYIGHLQVCLVLNRSYQQIQLVRLSHSDAVEEYKAATAARCCLTSRCDAV
jgi:hypothetical protein